MKRDDEIIEEVLDDVIYGIKNKKIGEMTIGEFDLLTFLEKRIRLTIQKTREDERGFRSYFLFKPSVKTHKVCYNAKSKNCGKCQEECDLAGK